jgi:hypothetical protein
MNSTFEHEILVCDLNVTALLGADILGSKHLFIFDMRKRMQSAPDTTTLLLYRGEVRGVERTMYMK